MNNAIFRLLTGCEGEGGELVLVLEVHQGGGVGLAEGEAGDGDQPGASIRTARLVGGHPGDVHWIVFLILRKLPEPS